MDIIEFGYKIDSAIRRKLKCKVDPETKKYIDITPYQRENLVNLYTEFSRTYSGAIIDYIEDITSDEDFVKWCDKHWSSMFMSVALHHTHANILEAVMMAAIKGYMAHFHVLCSRVGANDLYEKRLKETAKFLEVHNNFCNVQ
jgi:hypothetical protein